MDFLLTFLSPIMGGIDVQENTPLQGEASHTSGICRVLRMGLGNKDYMEKFTI
jgi:hypothetical protein